MDTYLSTVNSEIEKFNQYANVNVDGLKSRGEKMDYIMINLFKSYQLASDGEFVRYINIKRDQYNDGYNVSPDKLMTSALKKFKILRNYNKWNTMSPDQEHIVALSYVVEKLKEKNLKLSKIFNTLPPEKGNVKGKVKGKGQGKKPTGEQSQYGKGK